MFLVGLIKDLPSAFLRSEESGSGKLVERSPVLGSWLISSRTGLVESLNSFASSRRYVLVFGLKKKRISSLIRVFDEISPMNRLSNYDPFMSN